jgi:endonuclease/exonuclease/phosphatase family metal-dependent hydrolase
MSVNLLHERSDVDRFAQVLDELAPDVVVAQELAPAPADVLAERYPNHRLRPATDYSGRGIATRLDATFDDIPMPGRVGISASVAVGSRTVRVAGVHFLNPVKFPWWPMIAGRRRQLDALLRWADAGLGPTVVAGDFNASPSWPLYKRLAERFADLVAEHKTSQGERPERTWSWRPGWPRMLRIDHVFGVGVSVFDSLVVPISGSDHRAVIVDVALSSTGA